MGTEREVRADAETRYYAVTGLPEALDGLERALRRVEWIGEQRATRIVYAFVDGQSGARLTIRRTEGAEGEAGAPLPRLENEADIQAIYLTDITAGGGGLGERDDAGRVCTTA